MSRCRALVVLGTGGLARETVEAVRAVNDVAPTFDLVGFADDDPARRGTVVLGLPVLGPLDLVHDRPEVAVVAAIGNPSARGVRQDIVARLGLPAGRFATVVHPAASLGGSCEVGPGSVVLAGTVLTACVRVGSHVAVMPGAVLTHDDVVEDFATVASGVRLGGSVRVRRCAYLGAGSLVREQLTVGEAALLGMGSVLIRDLPPGQTWAGNPARPIATQPVTNRLISPEGDRT